MVVVERIMMVVKRIINSNIVSFVEAIVTSVTVKNLQQSYEESHIHTKTTHNSTYNKHKIIRYIPHMINNEKNMYGIRETTSKFIMYVT